MQKSTKDKLYDLGPASILAFISAIQWAPNLTDKASIAAGICVIFMLFGGISDYLMCNAGVIKPARTSIWLSIALAPYLGRLALDRWNNIFISQAVTVIAFVVISNLWIIVGDYVRRHTNSRKE
jgi:hypothetical protein